MKPAVPVYENWSKNIVDLNYLARSDALTGTRNRMALRHDYDSYQGHEVTVMMVERYDLARVVDPTECRIIEVREDGRVSMNESCYGIWNAEQKCLNCSSAMACRTGRRQQKAERFQDDVYFIQSNPVKLKLPDGEAFDAVVELVSVEEETDLVANNREAENIGDRAAHYLSHHDSLTNVLHANTFYELSREIIKNNPDTSWVMITCNIMNFRLINTLFGDAKGNDVLIRTASALREIAEEASGLCGRLGGDQFALLIPEGNYREESLTNTAQMLADVFNSGLYTFCIHFGVYEVDDPSAPVSVMCGRANSALRTIREDMTRVVAYFDDSIRQKLLLEQEEIDDFGKGYSSLGLLKTIEADVLKLDMSLVREIQDGQRNRSILESVISLAESLGMDVIAEGVETEQQLHILSEMS